MDENAQRFFVGRSKECSYVVNNPFVSRHHAALEYHGSQCMLVDANSTNGTYLNSPDSRIPPNERHPLRQGDVVYFSPHYKIPADLLINKIRRGISDNEVDLKQFPHDQTVIRIGRAPDNDIPITSLFASRYHAEVHTHPDGSRTVQDLGSKSGIYVNDVMVRNQTVRLDPDAKLEVGGVRICIQFSGKPGGRAMVGQQREGIFVLCHKLGHVVADRDTKAPKALLSNLSLSIYPGEFIGLMGPSGCGKTTFLTAINGDLKFTEGGVFYNGLDLKQNLSRFVPQSGYVPQDDIMHAELTVREVLYFNARIKLGKEVADRDIYEKIDAICQSLGLYQPGGNLDLRGTLIGSPEQKFLSGGQKKRVNLAIELLTDPKILFLDEPTSGLSAADTVTVMELLRKLADEKGIAIVITIHQPSLKVYSLMDKIIYLKQGKLCYFGKSFPDSVRYFVPEEQPEVAGPDAVMERLDRADVTSMEREYTQSSEFQELVVGRASQFQQTQVSNKSANPKRVSGFIQLPKLTSRYLKCKLRDKGSMIILMIQAPLIGILLSWAFTDESLNMALFLLVFVSLWFGTNNSAKELVGEKSIYRREQRSGLSPWAYLASKLLIQAGLTFIQCFVLVALSYLLLGFKFNFLLGFGICWMVSMTGISIGLLVSALARTEVAAIVMIPLILIPFILFGGAVIKYDDMGGFTRGFANTLVPARWAYESIVHAERSGGRGFDQNPEEQVDEMKGKLEDMKSTVEDLASENEQLRRGGSPRRTEIDSEEEDEEETAFNKDSFLPFAKDQRGFRQTQWDKNILLGFFALMVMMILLTVGTHQRLRKRG